ncbi:MAG: prolyl-tRNA synthetase associated domain-containing protein [Alphaproteobacteria bacterium]|jgi:Ala-tRNA(Pro) deacylase|nr:prolyl-tRNA synthetase associated domain-containing protein [Alphaproteobacteria bacterium]
MPHQKLFELFKKYGLDYELFTHEPLFTAEDAEKLQVVIEGAHGKNLFLKDKKKQYFLVSVLDSKRVDLKALAKKFASGHLSFGSAEELACFLGVAPGSVTPYGLLNDKDRKVKFLLDKDFLTYDLVNFHPLRNDMTISVRLKHFLTFFENIDHNPQIEHIPEIV